MAKAQLTTIHIKDITLQTIVGIFDWERHKKQKVVINIWIDYDAAKAMQTDQIQFAVDYKAITKRILKEAQTKHFFLIEKLAQKVLDIILEEKKVLKVVVQIDKPGALRYARSVSVQLIKERSKR